MVRPIERTHFEPHRPGLDRGQSQPGIAAYGIQKLTRNEIGDVRFASLQQRHACGVLGDALHNQRFDIGRLTPVLGEGLELHLDACLLAHEAVRSGSNWRLLETIRTDLLIVGLGYHPASATRSTPIQGQEVKERRFEVEADGAGICNLDSVCLVVQELGVRAAVLLECELDIFRCDRIAVVELDALA